LKLSKGRLAFTLGLLFLINFMNFYDRQVIAAMGESIKREWLLSDSQLSGLTTAFILLYAVIGIPLGRLADVAKRKTLLAAGALVWSGFTALSGFAGNFAALFACRLGVGVGEATAAPTGNSLIGDLFPPKQRARAISIFMLGIPLGVGASNIISGMVAKSTGGWRPAFFVAAVPGIVLGLLALALPEPPRGAVDPHLAEQQESSIESIRTILRIPTMWWIIASGALFNLSMYALAVFTTSFLIRFHGLDIDYANRFSGGIYGIGGAVGMLFGGWLGDRSVRWGPGGRLKCAAIASFIAAPLVWAALQQPKGAYWAFFWIMLTSCVVLYVYYATVVSTMHEIVAPRMRGMAMSVYFFVFYMFTAIGLLSFGKLSDGLAARALAAGASVTESVSMGLHEALYVVPLISAIMAPILWIGSRTAVADHAKLHGTSAA